VFQMDHLMRQQREQGKERKKERKWAGQRSVWAAGCGPAASGNTREAKAAEAVQRVLLYMYSRQAPGCPDAAGTAHRTNPDHSTSGWNQAQSCVSTQPFGIMKNMQLMSCGSATHRKQKHRCEANKGT
jgi:hypothetical protein